MARPLLFTYRSLIYSATFLTGATGLTFQVVWQKYLSYLVGSESRSLSLVVAVFLLGLAGGYRFWGGVSEGREDRRGLLKLYGYLELGIGSFAIAFPLLFPLLQSLNYAGPDLFAMDFLVALLALLLPTFLMGATIPLLTTVVPEHLGEVSRCHARIYGINTLGAFLGCFAGGFFLLPRFGLSMSLLIGGMVNIAVALLFITNRLSGRAARSAEVETVENSFGSAAILLFVFTVGAVSISFEILFMRLLGLAIGSGHYIFPIVVGVYVLGLALGSLTLRAGKLTLAFFFRQILLLVTLLVLVYLSVPYWPWWLSLARLKTAGLPGGYGLYLFTVSFFMAALSIPFLIPMGRLLPLGYAMIDKNRRDYGKVCGQVYFINTLGTVVGAVGLAHLLLYFLDADGIFKMNILLLLAATAFLLVRQGRMARALLALGAVVAVLALPAWDRSAHHLGLFRVHRRALIPGEGVFNVPKLYRGEAVSFGDGPNSTVTVLERAASDGEGKEATFVVNGKSDGDTEIDYSTMSLAAVLPYLYAPGKRDLSATVIGLGTGITAGILAGAEDVEQVLVLEISPLAMAALPLFDGHNGALTKNRSVTVRETDAFRYFAKVEEKADVIVAEPSTPWVVGVENLYTPEFYQLLNSHLPDDGVYLQWMQIGENSREIFLSVLENLSAAFPYLRLYRLSVGDIGIVASRSPLRLKEDRFTEKIVAEVRGKINIRDGELLDLLQVYDQRHLRWLAGQNTLGTHDFDTPRIGHAAARAMFEGSIIAIDSLLGGEVARRLFEGEKEEALRLSLERYPEGLPGCGGVRAGREVLCRRFDRFRRLQRARLDPSVPLTRRLRAYGVLRELGLLPRSPEFLEAAEGEVFEDPAAGKEEGAELLLPLLREYAREGMWEESAGLIEEGRGAGMISEDLARNYRERLEASRSLQSSVLSEWEGAGPWPGLRPVGIAPVDNLRRSVVPKAP